MTVPAAPEDGAPRPSFDSLPLSPEVRRALATMGYDRPTPVQLAVFEPASRGKNLLVQARTGTGKTTAFGLPMVDQIVRKAVQAVQALVLCPTRELALQVSRELTRIAEFKALSITAVYGGAPMGQQIDALAGGAQIVVGTPGRVLDHIRRGTLKTAEVRLLVLDEADEMLSMGFAKELTAIVESLPKGRQGLFFSATIPPDMERLAASHLKDPEIIALSSDQVGALEIGHFVYTVSGGTDKRQAMLRILEVEDPESAILFCNTKDETERLTEALQNKGFDADLLNGDMAQNDRERVMARTREGKLRFLVATDVAARGIDISHLTHVINFDFPEQAESYVHRTGRTGRAGRTGTAISLVGPKDIGNLYLLRLTYKIRPIEKQLPSAGELKTRAEQDLVQLFEEAFASREIHVDDLALARRILTLSDGERIVAGLIRDHLGARSGDAKAEAAEARRAKNPPKVIEPKAVEPPAAPSPPVDRAAARILRPSNPRHVAKEAGNGVPRERRDRVGMPQKAYATWEPRVDPDDDKPIMAEPQVSPAAPPRPAPAAAARPAPAGAERRRERPPVKVEIDTDTEQRLLRQAGFSVDASPSVPIASVDRAGVEAPSEMAEEGLVEIFVNVGRRDGARTSDIQRLLEAELPASESGRIRMRDKMTFVSVPKASFEKAIDALAGHVVGGRTLSAQLAKPRQPPIS